MRVLFVGLFTAVPAIAMAFPLQFTHQGRVTDAAGVPVHGSHTLTFSVYAGPETTSVLWDDDITVSLEDCHYSVVLGADATDPIQSSWLLAHDALYIGVKVDSNAELTPRSQIVPVPFAVAAQNVVGGTVDASEIRVDDQVVVSSDGSIPAERIAGGSIDSDITFNGTVTVNGPLVSKGSIIASPNETTYTAFLAGYPDTWRNTCGDPDYHPCGLAEAWVRLYSGGATGVGTGTYWTTGSISREGDGTSTKGLLASWWGSSPAGTDCSSGTHLAQTVYASPESQFHAPGCRDDGISYKMLCCYNY